MKNQEATRQRLLHDTVLNPQKLSSAALQTPSF